MNFKKLKFWSKKKADIPGGIAPKQPETITKLEIVKDTQPEISNESLIEQNVLLKKQVDFQQKILDESELDNKTFDKAKAHIKDRLFCHTHKPAKRLEEWVQDEKIVRGCKDCGWFQEIR